MLSNHDIEIIEAITLKNNITAEKKLYDRIYPYILNLVLKYHYSVDDAKDIFQDCLMILICKINNKLKLHCSLATFMYAIAKNLILKRRHEDFKLYEAIKTVSYDATTDLEAFFMSEKDTEGEMQLKKQLLNKYLSQMKEDCIKIIFSSNKETRRKRWSYKQKLKRAILNDPDFILVK